MSDNKLVKSVLDATTFLWLKANRIFYTTIFSAINETAKNVKNR